MIIYFFFINCDITCLNNNVAQERLRNTDVPLICWNIDGKEKRVCFWKWNAIIILRNQSVSEIVQIKKRLFTWSLK